MTSNARRWAAGVGVAGGAAVAAAMIGAAGTPPVAHADTYDPAVFDYSQDPTNIFSPVYIIQPVGPEDVIGTDAYGDIYGTQDFSVSVLGFPVDTFTGGVEYGAVSSPLDPFGNPYVEDVSVIGVPGTVLPENTGFLVEEFGGGWGNVLEEQMNDAGTSTIIGDYLLSPFGDTNITPIVEYLMNYTGTLTDAASAVDPSSFADLLSSIGF